MSPKSPFRKKDFPVVDVRRFLEPGPIVLVSSAWRGETDIMAMGWHMVMEFSPSLVGCIISSANRSFELVRKSRECVINLPTYDMLDQVTGIGSCSGGKVEKFGAFGLTPLAAERVGAPLIGECHANFECRLADASKVAKYNLFIWEVVKAHVRARPVYPETIHYRGGSVFMKSGRSSVRRTPDGRRLP